MSYLPRLSKTYKEPNSSNLNDLDITSESSYSVQPASSLLNEKTNNPQIMLKHYKYLPHTPPVLPGPSLSEEVKENELMTKANRNRRSTFNENLQTRQVSFTNSSLNTAEESDTSTKIEDTLSSLKRTVSQKKIKEEKLKKKLPRHHSDKKKKDINADIFLAGSSILKSNTPSQTSRHSRSDDEQSELSNKDETIDLKRDKSFVPPLSEIPEKQKSTMTFLKEIIASDKSPPGKPKKEIHHKSIQCTIFGSTDKVYVIPFVITTLLRALAFLLHELHREESVNSGEKKRLLPQIQLILGDLCNQKIDKEFGFDTTFSDSKRVEKILEDLQKYIKAVYGDKGEYIDKMEDTKRVFIELKKKEIELSILNEKLQESRGIVGGDLEVKESDFKNPEVTLQNKRLESEQLLAKVEFSSRDLKNYQKSLAEIDWDLKILQEEATTLRRSSRSRTEITGRKVSSHKFSSENLGKVSRSRRQISSAEKSHEIL